VKAVVPLSTVLVATSPEGLKYSYRAVSFLPYKEFSDQFLYFFPSKRFTIHSNPPFLFPSFSGFFFLLIDFS